MKVLVVYYSLSGNTRKLGELIAQSLAGQAEVAVEELTETKERKGFRGFLATSRDALTRRKSGIEPLKADVSSCEIVVIGTPVWAMTMASPVRTFLGEHANRFKEVAFFLTTGGAGVRKTFRDMEALCGKTPLATLGISEKELKDDEALRERVKTFVNALSEDKEAD